MSQNYFKDVIEHMEKYEIGISSCKNNLDEEEHTCPLLPKLASIASLTALEISASGKTIIGFFPPNSNTTGFMPFAAFL